MVRFCVDIPRQLHNYDETMKNVNFTAKHFHHQPIHIRLGELLLT